MSKLNFQITTPERIVYQDEIDQVTIPTKKGQITILPNHIPLVSILETGELLVKKNNETTPMFVSGGFLEVRKNNKIIILADSAEKIEEIDEERAEKARARAEELKKEKFTQNVHFVEASAALERAMSRLKIARKYKHRAR